MLRKCSATSQACVGDGSKSSAQLSCCVSGSMEFKSRSSILIRLIASSIYNIRMSFSTHRTVLDYVILRILTLTLSSNSLHHVVIQAACVLLCVCISRFLFVCCLSDRWRCEGQSVVGVGSHSHSIWEETDKKVGEPAPYRPTVSIEHPLTWNEERLSLLNLFI